MTLFAGVIINVTVSQAGDLPLQLGVENQSVSKSNMGKLEL